MRAAQTATSLLIVLTVTSGFAPATPQTAAEATPAVTAAWHAPATTPRYAVRPGDTLSSIAARLCGRTIDWTGLYHTNRGVIGWNPDQIRPRQELTIACYDPPVTTARIQPQIRARAHDDDGDGDDGSRPPAQPGHATTAYRPAPPAGAGYYSYAGLEQLWRAAGGPAWAASHAASIAECESGGRVYAYNASGATGLWQILGQVVPGNLYNPYVNVLNAVAKFRASGDTFAQWVCR